MFVLIAALAVFAGGVQVDGGHLQIPFETKAECVQYEEQITRDTIATKADWGGDYIMITSRCEAF